ncbi:MAG: hypothetical protein JWM16_323 [Verrucomicrobiales bacterium]|nr:hypothetical protein [Verrucomicrobiales bacterium]
MERSAGFVALGQQTIATSIMIRLLLLVIVFQQLALAQEKPTAPTHVPNFKLPDQHDKLRYVQFPRSKPTMFIVSDQKGSKEIEAWVRPVRRRFDTQIEIDGIADLTPVPKRLRGVVRRAFKDELDYSVMLDWEGGVSKDFRYTKEKANVFVVDTTGKVLFHTAGRASPEQFKKVYAILDAALKSIPQAEERRRGTP